MSLYDMLYEFFYTHIFYCSGEAPNMDLLLDDIGVDIGNLHLFTNTYLSHIGAIISITIILVLCCLFIYKIVRLIGGLIR